VEVGGELFAVVVEAGVEVAVEVVRRARVEGFGAALAVVVAAGTLPAAWLCPPEPDELPLPQPASSAVSRSIPPTPPRLLLRGQLIEKPPSGELIESTDSWPARALAA
jgi:hypothetical protein